MNANNAAVSREQTVTQNFIGEHARTVTTFRAFLKEAQTRIPSDAMVPVLPEGCEHLGQAPGVRPRSEAQDGAAGQPSFDSSTRTARAPISSSPRANFAMRARSVCKSTGM
jgi:hypothetical protein